MKIRSLRFKINAAILVTSVLIAAIFGTILYPFEMRRHTSYEKKVYLLLDTVFLQKKDDLANELFARQKRALTASLNEMLKVEGISAITVYLPDGEVFLATHDAFATRLSQAERDLAGGSSAFVPEIIRSQHRSLGIYTREIGVIGMPVGYIRIYYDFAELERETLISIWIFVTLLVTTLIAMSGLLNFLLSRFVMKPIFLLRNAILKLQKGHLGETVHLTSTDEIGEVGHAFNEMSVELKQSQVALRQAEEKYRGIFENATEGIFQRTPGNGRYLTVNPSMFRMLGYETEEELLSRVTDIANELYVNPEDHEEFERAMAEQGYIVDFETQLHRKDGSVIWVSISARRIEGENEPSCYYEGSLVDITERREKEKAERAREAAEAASKAKSEFLANMSHEIRTPMNAILGFTSLLIPLVTSAQQKSYVQSIQSSGKSLMSIINDILDLSKIEAGKMEIHYEPVSLRTLFEELERIFSLSVQEKGLTFITEIAREIPSLLLLDEVRLRQVLFNLVGNAVKFTKSGWIRLSANKGEVLEDRGLHLVIGVEDTGIGIQPEAQEKVFESFRQQFGQNKRLYGGTGLGLTISKHLIQMMGGAISVRSRPGVGSVFEVRLPHVAEAPIIFQPEPAKGLDVEAFSYGKGTILVVDDMELNRNLIREFLKNTGIEILEADNGQTAFQAARQCQPEVILMDIKMPVMDGYEALRHLRQDVGTRSIPVVALTASAMREDLEKIEKSGFDGWLLRPFEQPELLEILSHHIHRSQTDSGLSKGLGADVLLPAEGIPFLSKEIWDKIIHPLENELMAQWKIIRRRQRILDIEEFAHRIKALGDKYDVQYLSAYAEDLLLHTASFDVENIHRALDAYPEFVAGIERLEPR